MSDSLGTDSAEWYKDVVIYQVHVRSFFDSNADGIGDFKGLIQKLEYIKFLGVTAIWLLPFYPSPLKDEGYDVADYTDINPIYGNLTEFKAFLKQAHAYNIKVITELVINHTSSQHPWFQRARLAKPGSRWRNFYTWSNTGQEYPDARVIFNHAESSNWTWDPVAQAYYWHRFYSHQPDLNYENPEVQKAVLKVVDFWFNLGVDGLRLDAIPYLFQKEGTNCENLEETHQFLKKLNAHIQQNFKNRFLLAEANQWAEETVRYFGEAGDECQMAYNFPLLPKLYMAVQMGDRRPLVDIVEQTPTIPENCQWAIFLRNHDALALEMLTDEECDYMYRIYAKDKQMRINDGIRRRLATLMEGDRRKIELLNVLLLSLPGTPIIYYGDEIGMGDNIYLDDRNSVRTPMQWSNESNAGFSKGTPQKLCFPVVTDPEYHYQMINVGLQRQNKQSLLWWMKNIIELRNQYQAFGRGRIIFLSPDNIKVLAFYRIYQEQVILVLVNLSQNIQSTFIDLSTFSGHSLVEMFGRNEFPLISDAPYFFTFPAYGFMWLEVKKVEATQDFPIKTPEINLKENLAELFGVGKLKQFEIILQNYLEAREDYDLKKHRVIKIHIVEFIRITSLAQPVYFLILEAEIKDKLPEKYHLFITEQMEIEIGAVGDLESNTVSAQRICKLTYGNSNLSSYVMDATQVPMIWKGCWVLFNKETSYKGIQGRLKVSLGKSVPAIASKINAANMVKVDQDIFNTQVYWDNTLRLKIYKVSEQGIHPEIEMHEVLSENSTLKLPRILAKLEYQHGEQVTILGIVQECFEGQKPGWEFNFHGLNQEIEPVNPLPWPTCLMDSWKTDIPHDIYEILGNYTETVKTLAVRTAQMHITLACAVNFPSEKFTLYDQRALYQSLRSQSIWVNKRLESLSLGLDSNLKNKMITLLGDEGLIRRIIEPLLYLKIGGDKIRCHGDYDLNQFLWTENDFAVLNLEGEPNKPFSERKIKRPPFKDLAAILCSFYYNVDMFVAEKKPNAEFENSALGKLYAGICQLFLQTYFETPGIARFLPEQKENILLLLKFYLIEKMLHKIEYEISTQSQSIHVPCHALIRWLN